MAALESTLAASRALRNESKLAFDVKLAEVREDLEARGIAQRVADQVAETAKTVFDEGVDVVQEHPGVVGGTIVALVLWILRNPIIGWLEELLGPRR